MLPAADDPVPARIFYDSKFYPFFEDAIGAMDGTHIKCNPEEEDHAACRNRKGTLTQNCLVACSFDLRFQYVLTGWEGSAADASIYNKARFTTLPVPEGKYYLGDAGFPSCDTVLVPYRNVRYHLAEWGRANQRYVYCCVFSCEA